MWQLREILNSLEGSTLDVTTEYLMVSGALLDVNFDYIVLRANTNLLYIPLESIKSVAY
jgi:hypothetical protein